jgi:hypothetical protein
VDKTGNNFLAGAFVTTDQHAGAGICSLTNAFQNHPHGRVVTNQARPAGTLAQSAAGSVLQHAPNDRHGQVMVERPGQKLGGTRAKSRDHFSNRALASQGHNRSPRLARLRSAYQLRTTFREVHVQDAEIERLRAQSGACRLCRRRHNVLALQRRGDVLEGSLYDGISVNEKEPLCHAWAQISAEEIFG